MSDEIKYRWKAIGPFKTLVSGIIVGEHAALTRRCVILNQPDCPVSLSDFDIKFAEQDGTTYSSGIEFQVFARQGVSAIKFMLIPFDLFNSQERAHYLVKAISLSEGEDAEITMPYEIPGEELSTEFTYFLYVARVRLQDGTIWKVGLDKVSEALDELGLELNPQAA